MIEDEEERTITEWQKIIWEEIESFQKEKARKEKQPMVQEVHMQE